MRSNQLSYPAIVSRLRENAFFFSYFLFLLFFRPPPPAKFRIATGKTPRCLGQSIAFTTGRLHIFFGKNMPQSFVVRNKVPILAADNRKTMERQKIHLQYSLNATSKTLLWNAISTPSGLEDWFADRVQSDDKTVTFYWGKTESRSATIIAVRAYSFIRFRWTDGESDREYFELKMTNSELTNDFTLEITDFADADEVDDSCELWNSEVETLRRKCGF